MAPTKGKARPTKGANKRSSKPSKETSSITKSARKPSSASKSTAVKARSARNNQPPKKKKRVYTEKELNIPTLNVITPAGVQKPRGAKKGKIFVDDKESMMAILAMVQAEKEGSIESKMIRARQMEEIREARRVEAEKKEAARKGRLEGAMEDVKRSKKRAKLNVAMETKSGVESKEKMSRKPKKRVSFG
ncbi:60S ribosomal subunit assembly/export protein [Elasticomyces elasticus]|nr:60S ribosomal subunit assembly/export protein [Elasticomyces elasticus]